MDLIRRDKDKAVALGKAQGLRGDIAIERKALDYYAQDLDIRLQKENIVALLKQIDVAETPQKYFDDSYGRAGYRGSLEEIQPWDFINGVSENGGWSGFPGAHGSCHCG
jgi:hypothetical protein